MKYPQVYANKMLTMCLLLIFTTVFCANQKKPWTVLTYIAGDNSLAQFVQVNLNQMKQGANKNVYSLAFVSTKNGSDKSSKKLVITPGAITQDGAELPNLDSGNAQTAIQAVSWAIENYPSDKLAIIFWDHGSGPLNRTLFVQQRGFCYDDTTGNYLKDTDLITILTAATQARNKNVDIVAFDACLMADIEIAYTAMPYANYLVSSQQTIPGTGYDYNHVLSSLAKKVLDGPTFARAMVAAYGNYYKSGTEDYTLSAMDLSKVSALVDNINQLSVLLSQLIGQDQSVSGAITSAAAFNSTTIRFDEPDYIDLYNFYLNVYQAMSSMNITAADKASLGTIINDGLSLIKALVLVEVASPQFAAVRGVSIYLPQTIDPSYLNLYWSNQTQWLSFLQTYIPN
jgi:hypothetical protein